MGKGIDIELAARDGGTFSGYLAIPASTPAPGDLIETGRMLRLAERFPMK